MAYDPTIPALENYIGDDIPKIMANFAELAGSRIVEMGSNNSGTYVRWENGLQVCFGEKMTTYVAGTTVYTFDPVPLPAAFLDGSSYKVSSAPKLISDSAISDRFAIATLHHANTTASGFRVHLQAQTDKPNHTEIGVQYIAIGRWK